MFPGWYFFLNKLLYNNIMTLLPSLFLYILYPRRDISSNGNPSGFAIGIANAEILFESNNSQCTKTD